jgi:hypothetical protein
MSEESKKRVRFGIKNTRLKYLIKKFFCSIKLPPELRTSIDKIKATGVSLNVQEFEFAAKVMTSNSHKKKGN